MIKITNLNFKKIVDQNEYTVLLGEKVLGTINMNVEFTPTDEANLSDTDINNISRVFMAYIG